MAGIYKSSGKHVNPAAGLSILTGLAGAACSLLLWLFAYRPETSFFGSWGRRVAVGRCLDRAPLPQAQRVELGVGEPETLDRPSLTPARPGARQAGASRARCRVPCVASPRAPPRSGPREARARDAAPVARAC